MLVSEKSDKDKGQGISVVDLGVAAASSAVAALIVSRFWQDGTAISAALTPVLVTLIREAIARPTAKVGEVTARRRERIEAPAAAGAAPPPEDLEDAPPAYDQGGAFDSEPGVRVYGRSSRNKLHLRLALITGLLGFAIAAVLLTAPELITGKSLTGDGKRTTLFQGKERGSKKEAEKDSTTTTPDTVTTEEPAVTEEAPAVPQEAPPVPEPEAAPQPQQDAPPQDGGAPAPAVP
ncbi:MAG: hypothetical protein H0T15_03105 [Thermoleophilaceae bacterium]|nr:hypothetical protein [Thermoleophilaceae bacterium]